MLPFFYVVLKSYWAVYSTIASFTFTIISVLLKIFCFIEFSLQIPNCPHYFIQSFVCVFLDVSQVFIPVIHLYVCFPSELFEQIYNHSFELLVLIGDNFYGVNNLGGGIFSFWGAYYFCCCERTQASGDWLLGVSFDMFLAHWDGVLR